MNPYYPVKFKPIAMERVWGGHKLKLQFGEEQSNPVGEYWVLSGHPNGTSVVVNGGFSGQTLTELCTRFPEAYLGDSPQGRFPLLIKFLEAETDLSVQVHPDDDYARDNEGDYGKTEAWYVLDCKEDGRVNYGHCFTSKEQYLSAVADGHVQDYLVHQSIERGSLIFVPARTLHALLAGTKVLEIQQTSDVTYRVYDWDRVDDKGMSRELHIEQAAKVLTFDNPEGRHPTPSPMLICQTNSVVHQRLVTCPYFTIEKLVINDGQHVLSRGKRNNPDVIVVVKGTGILSWDDTEQLSLAPGETVLIPATLEKYALKTNETIEVIRTYY